MTDAATMRKISYWRYSAVNLKTLFAALACALLVFSMLGCGTTNHLQSITLQVIAQNGVPVLNQSGAYELLGAGGTLQLQALGHYSSGATKILNNVNAVYNMAVDPGHNVDAYGVALPNPGQTAAINATGFVTAIEPLDCTWVDSSPDPAKATWFFSGAYLVTATFGGMTSQPAFVIVASKAGNPDNIFTNPPLIGNNPGRHCGPNL
jgi:hypothetical protein